MASQMASQWLSSIWIPFVGSAKTCASMGDLFFEIWPSVRSDLPFTQRSGDMVYTSVLD